MKKLDFMIVGAQKCGTTALAQFLSQHPDIGMAEPKEAHAFDHEDYANAWTDELLDEYYGAYFTHLVNETQLGEATPIYGYLADAPQRIGRWQPKMKIIFILRDPVERAWSHYQMAVSSGFENLPYWLALLVEPLRLWLCASPLAPHSAVRENSYRSRGLYGKQLRRYLSVFPREQVLVVRSEDLAQSHDQTLSDVFSFLGVSESVSVPADRVNQGVGVPAPGLCSALLRLSYGVDLFRLGRLVNFPVGGWRLGRLGWLARRKP